MLLISDLHLGAGDAADDFGPADGPQDDALCCFLDDFAPRMEVAVLGDVVDLIQCSEREVWQAHPYVCKKLARYVTYWLRGNHDNEPRVLGRRTEESVLRHGVLMMHGHQFDPLNYGRWRLVGKAGSWAAGWIERAFGANADLVLDRWLAKRLLPGRFGDPARYRKRALHYIRRVYGAERIVLGHTHGLTAVVNGYGNTGSWVDGRQDYLII
jgi:UDP-2,3-diacylglucosamine pyrophosphatase LpxH